MCAYVSLPWCSQSVRRRPPPVFSACACLGWLPQIRPKLMSGNASEPGYVGGRAREAPVSTALRRPAQCQVGQRGGSSGRAGSATGPYRTGIRTRLKLDCAAKAKPETAAKKPMTAAHLLRTPKQASVHALQAVCQLPQRSVPPVWPPVSASAVSLRKMSVAGGAVAQWETGATMPTIGARRAELAKLLNIQFLELLPEAEVGSQATGLVERQLATVDSWIMTELPGTQSRSCLW